MTNSSQSHDVADDFATSVVPEEARLPRLKLTMASWSLLTAMAWLFYGALAATLVGTQQAIIGLVVTVVVFGAVNSLMVRLGTSTGLGSSMVSRRVFGAPGAALIAVLLALTTIYFGVFEGSVVAEAFLQQWGGDIRIWYAVVVLGMLPLMMGGVLGWMDRVNGVLLPFYVIGLVVALVVAAGKGDPGQFLSFAGMAPPEAQVMPGWLQTVIIYLGIWLVMPTTVDFARFGRPTDTRYLQTVTFGWFFAAGVFLVNGVAGMFLVQMVLPGAAAGGETGVVGAIVGPLGLFGVLWIVVTQVRINTLNFYQSSINLQRLVHQFSGVRAPRQLMVVLASVIVFVLMLTDVFSYLQTALAWQGTFFVGWGGIMAVHLLVRGRLMDAGGGTVPALAIWVCSALLGIVLIEFGSAIWSAYAPLISLVVAVVAYLPVAVAGRRRLAAGTDSDRRSIRSAESH